MEIYSARHINQTPNFRPDEFDCKCDTCQDEIFLTVENGIPYNVTFLELVLMLQDARTRTGFPYLINSGSRCPRHEARVSKSKHKTHLRGFASDISTSPEKLARYGLDLTENEIRGEIFYNLEAVGFKRLGISYKDHFIHADILPTDRRILWGYDGK